MKERIKKQRLNLTLPPQAIRKAKDLADAMNISISHLIEGLIAGATIVPHEHIFPKKSEEEVN